VTWNPSDLQDADIDGIAYDGCDASRIYAVGRDASYRNLFVSADGGLHWTRSARNDVGVATITIDPHNPARLFASDGYRGVYETSDSGAHWSFFRDIDPLEYGGGVGRVVFDPDDSQRIFVTSGYPPIHRSTDGGLSWEDLNIADQTYVATALVAWPGGSLLASTDSGVFRSSDRGDHWQSISAVSSIQVLEAVSSDSELLFAISAFHHADGSPYEQLLASRDGGATWRALPVSFDSLSCLTVDQSGRTIYVEAYAIATQEASLLRSVDGGETFHEVFAAATAIGPIVVDPHLASTLYSGMNGLSLSKDGGATWKTLGSVPCEIVDLAITPDASVLHAASRCGEIDIRLANSVTAAPTAKPAKVSRP
jgi:photosystem II stability/assembly factor-like uncharacterized protein